jgi:hypothetical protein
MQKIDVDVVSIDFRILFGKLKPGEKQQNIIAAFLSVLANSRPLKFLGAFLKSTLSEKLAYLLEKGYISYSVLIWALKKFAKSYGIEIKLKELPTVNRILNVSVSLEKIDAKKLVALTQTKAPASAVAKINIAAVLSKLEPYADDIFNALLPALPGVVSELDEFIKEEAEKRFGVTLSDLKVSL